jgi:hypothetical protein
MPGVLLPLQLVDELAPLIAATTAAAATAVRDGRPSWVLENQARVRALLHEMDLRHFAADLDRLEPERQEGAMLLLEMMSRPEWFLDRRHRGVSITDTRAAVETLLRVALEP